MKDELGLLWIPAGFLHVDRRVAALWLPSWLFIWKGHDDRSLREP